MSLPRDLLRFHVQKDRLVGQFLEPDRPDLLRTAAGLIEVVGGSLGARRGEVEDEVGDVVRAARSAKIGRAMARVLFEGCRFERGDAERAAELRRTVFLAAATGRAEGTFDRQAILDAAGASDEDLHADLRSVERLVFAPDLEPAELIGRANVAQAEAFLGAAVTVEIGVDDGDDRRRGIVVSAVEASPLDLSMEEVGRSTLRLAAEATGRKRLGAPLAELFAAVREARVWRVEATLAWGKNRRSLRFALASEDPGWRAEDPTIPDPAS